jgi:predicted outer membrane repeat protein
MKRLTTLIILLLTTYIRLQSQTVIPGGDVFGDWKPEGSPFLIQGDVHIPSDQRLTVKPGVTIIFEGNYQLNIEGKIEAVGTLSDSITFTIADTTGFSQGIAGWNGISFTGYNYSFSENSVLKYCNIEYCLFSGLTCISYPFLTIEKSVIRNNKSAGLALYEFSDIVADNIFINNNEGGGLVSVYSAPHFTNFNISNNGGSGIILYGLSSGNLTATFSNGKIKNNTSQSNGGGIYLGDDSYIFGDNLEITNNSAINGGAIYCGMASAEFDHVFITNNIAEFGAGIFCSTEATIVMNFSLIARNVASFSGGGGIINDGKLNIENCTISNNSALVSGGGLEFNLNYTYPNQINNSIIWDNQPNEITYSNEMPEVSYSDIKDGFSGDSNIDADPLFSDPAMNDYHLTWISFPVDNGMKSPCIDSGNPDMAHDPDGTTSDVGAFYFDQGVFTSIDQNIGTEEILIYPNPSKDHINIRSVKELNSVKIINLAGEIVLDQMVSNGSEQIDITSLESGIYFVNLLTDQNMVAVKKIIKK